MYAMLPFLFTQCEYDMLFLRPDGAHVRVRCALLETLPDARSLQTLVCCIAQISCRHVVCGHHFLRYVVAVFWSKSRHKVTSMAALLGGCFNFVRCRYGILLHVHDRLHTHLDRKGPNLKELPLLIPCLVFFLILHDFCVCTESIQINTT